MGDKKPQAWTEEQRAAARWVEFELVPCLERRAMINAKKGWDLVAECWRLDKAGA